MPPCHLVFRFFFTLVGNCNVSIIPYVLLALMENLYDSVGLCATKAPYAQASGTEHTYAQHPSVIVNRISSTSTSKRIDSTHDILDTARATTNIRRHDSDLCEGTTAVATRTGGAHDKKPLYHPPNTCDP